VIDDDQWGWTIDGKTADGEKLRLSATFQRKQS
jgi:hypothetical protein